MKGGRFVRILKRFLNFIASRMFFLTVISALLIMSFYLAMNTANIWVLIDDGLDARAVRPASISTQMLAVFIAR